MKPSYLIAAGVAVVVTGWIASGQMNGAKQVAQPAETVADKPTPDTATALQAVRVRKLVAWDRINELVLFGRTEAVRMVSLKAETAGRVITRAVTKGQRVAKGAVIARIAMEDRKSQLAEAEALVEQRRIAYTAGQQLSEKAFRSKIKLAENRAQLESAKAALERIRLDISHTAVRAPFEGVIENLPVEVGGYVGVGSDVAHIVDLDPMLIVGEVSERDVAKIKVGTRVQARLVTGRDLNGTVRYVSRVGVAATRTFRVEVAIDNADGSLAEGLTVEMRLPLGWVKAHRISPAVLTLSDEGVVGIKGVDAEGVVIFHPVQLIADTPEGMWLGGLPEELTAITVGQEFVTTGQKVRPVMEKADAQS
jgi:membrane fusion protein, multidrug efflux system